MNSTSNPEKKEDLGANIRKTKNVREIVQLLAKTSSQMKIFASHHSNIQKFADELYGKIDRYLDKHWKLEIGIEEFVFTFQGKSIYQDDQIKRSLPFLFFKDGVQALFFYKNLSKEEFLDFLDIIKRESALPAEESDIVISLWEKDFTNIRYAASDEFLESKIGVGMEPLEYKLDRTLLMTGKVELTPKDKEALERMNASEISSPELQDREAGVPSEITEAEMTSLGQSLSDSEFDALYEMLDANRRITAEDELIALIMEILYMEEKQEPFEETIRALEQCHEVLVAKRNYSRAAELLDLALELKDKLAANPDQRKDAIYGFIERIRNEEAIALLQRNVQEEGTSDATALLEYLRILGPKSIPVLSQLYNLEKNAQGRAEILKLLKELGNQDPPALMRIARDDSPSITNAIIAVLGDSEDRRAIPYLATFINYKNKSIKSEAIKALGKKNDETANRILLAFLKDDDEGFRILAAENLLYIREDSVKSHIINTVTDQSFKKKTSEEIRAFIKLLGRIQTAESRAILKSFIKRPGLFSGTKNKELSRHAVWSLEKMGTPEDISILEEGARGHSRIIREACQNSLRRLSQDASQHPGVKE